LPNGGANATALFGVGPGVNALGFFEQYFNPANFTANGFTSPLITSFADVLNISPGETFSLLDAAFKQLSPLQQELLVDQAFFQALNLTGLDYNNSSSPYYHQYSRGYEAINTLFPASYGYTQNALSGGTNGANQLVQTGFLDMRGSTIQTQQGGNISILGPGGQVTVGSAVGSPAVNPATEGILTLEKGNIDIFADSSVEVAQSRIMTEQGGDIVMWSSNGDLDAGKGAKTSVSLPPPLFSCDIDWTCKVDVKGFVSGAGIATLQSLPNVPTGNANLVAPRGTVNAGDAGIRVSGNLNVAALRVTNVFNLEVQGATTGIPTAVAPNLGALTSASNAAGQAAAAATDVARQARSRSPMQDLPSIITVEVIGYGGGDSDKQQSPQNERRKSRDQRSEIPPAPCVSSARAISPTRRSRS
jgi:hypothetical protein